MQLPRLSLSGIIGASWQTTKDNLGAFVMLSLAGFVPYLAIYFIGILLLNRSPFIGFLIVVASFIFLGCVYLGYLAVAMAMVEGKPWTVADVFNQTSKIGNFLLASILYGVVVGFGFLLFILPGIFWANRFSQYAFFILRGEGAMQSLKSSWALTDKSFWEVFGMRYVAKTMASLTLLPLGLGLLIIMPLSALMQAHTFKQLVENPVANR